MLILTTHLPDLIAPDAFARLGERAQYELLAQIADGARAFWIKTAGAALHTTKRDYLDGIQEVKMRTGVASIALVGVLPNLIENGMDAADLHDTLLGPSVPTTPPGRPGKHPKKGGGFYRAIPFRHGTPGTSGAVGAAMGSQYAGHPDLEAGFMSAAGGDKIFNAGQLGTHIYSVAKKLRGTRGMPGGKVQVGGRLPEGLAPKLREHHATDIYAGMVKSRKTYAKATQSQYTTFRMISTGSPGWMRAATEGKHFVRDVESYVARMAGRAAEAYLRSHVGGK